VRTGTRHHHQKFCEDRILERIEDGISTELLPSAQQHLIIDNYSLRDCKNASVITDLIGGKMIKHMQLQREGQCHFLVMNLLHRPEYPYLKSSRGIMRQSEAAWTMTSSLRRLKHR
jgi:hypothetical protein